MISTRIRWCGFSSRAERGRNALHGCAMKYDNTSRTARVLVEQCRGQDGVLLTVCHRMMFTIAKESNTNFELVRYLESFLMYTLLAAPGDRGGLALTLNPSLDALQLAIATDCLDLITTAWQLPDAAVYIMGYLSPSDVMQRPETKD